MNDVTHLLQQVSLLPQEFVLISDDFLNYSKSILSRSNSSFKFNCVQEYMNYTHSNVLTIWRIRFWQIKNAFKKAISDLTRPLRNVFHVHVDESLQENGEGYESNSFGCFKPLLYASEIKTVCFYLVYSFLQVGGRPQTPAAFLC